MRQNRVFQVSLLLCCVLQQAYGIGAAAAPLPPVAEADEKMVANCQFLGTVSGASGWAAWAGGRSKAMKSALKKAQLTSFGEPLGQITYLRWPLEKPINAVKLVRRMLNLT
ncbi:hypothetical protein [Altericista sp. CCNU0014]|uniref:hypothetical protein n=1 Tax=Altericista sp. CCNU0014 TaxID=3082949 RepID=UPI00384C31D2